MSRKNNALPEEQASELKDTDTAAIFTEIARGIDKYLWFVETSQQQTVEQRTSFNACYNAP